MARTGRHPPHTATRVVEALGTRLRVTYEYTPGDTGSRLDPPCEPELELLSITDLDGEHDILHDPDMTNDLLDRVRDAVWESIHPEPSEP